MSDTLLPEECRLSDDARKRLVLEGKRKERGPRFILENPCQRRLIHYRVDNCCLKTKACDDLVLIGEVHAYLVERKGSDLAEAIRQIEATLQCLGPMLGGRKLHARIVLNRVRTPDINSTQEIELKRRLGENYRRASGVLTEILP